MIHLFCFACILCVIFSQLARSASLIAGVILLIVAVDLGFTIAELMTPTADWEMKYVCIYFGAINICLIAPFLVIFRGNVPARVAVGGAAWLIVFTFLAMWRVFLDVQKGFPLSAYLLVAIPAFLIGWVIATIASSLGP